MPETVLLNNLAKQLKDLEVSIKSKTIRDNSLTLGQFKQHLKHHLFCAAYDTV